MDKNFFFIDDSGSKEWDTPYASSFVQSPPTRTDQNLNFWRKNYFVLAGIHIPQTTIAALNPQINTLKEKYFGTKYVEIKSDWLRNPKLRKKTYLDPFNITAETLTQFVEEWYQIFISNPEIEIQSFVLDKRYYKRRGHTPLQLLVQVLFDRVELHPHRNCAIVFDQMESEIKSVKNQHGQILKISDKEINLGSFHAKYSHTPPIFEKSKNSNFLQLADTVAYNVLRQFIDYGDLWEDGKADNLKVYPFLERLTGNFYNKDGRIAGMGIVKIPDIVKNKWGTKNQKTPLI